MWKNIKAYFWECTTLSFKASYSTANNVLGVALVSGAMSWLGSIKFIEGTSKFIQTINGVATLFVYFIGAWLALFIPRTVFIAPFLLYVSKSKRIADMETKISWHILGGLIYDASLDPSSGTTHSCMVEINNGNKPLRNCQIKLDNHLICEPFNLLPGDKKYVPIIRVHMQSDTRAAVYSYFQNNGKWQIDTRVKRLIVASGDYKLKLIAEDLYPPLEMTVNVVRNENIVEGWEMKQAVN